MVSLVRLFRLSPVPLLCALAACDDSELDFGPLRTTAGGFRVSASDFDPVEDVDIDAAIETQFEILLAKNPDLNAGAAREVLKGIPIQIKNSFKFQVITSTGYVWVTGDTDARSYIRVALYSFDPATGSGSAPYLPALNHEWGHVFFGPGYEH